MYPVINSKYAKKSIAVREYKTILKKKLKSKYFSFTSQYVNIAKIINLKYETDESSDIDRSSEKNELKTEINQKIINNLKKMLLKIEILILLFINSKMKNTVIIVYIIFGINAPNPKKKGNEYTK